MLIHLSVQNLAVVKSLDVDFKQGLSVITGETGAGKSIAIDALGLCLGNRADAGMVRPSCDKADVCATFDITNLPKVKSWLNENDLSEQETSENEHQELMIRRVVSSEGRSKAYVNGYPVPAQQLRSLGLQLISIHGQHAHQLLLKSEIQKQLVDNFAEHGNLVSDVKQQYELLNTAQKQMAVLLAGTQKRSDRRNLLQYQVQELDEFNIAENEFIELELEHKKLSNSQALLEQSQKSFYQLYDADEGSALNAVQSSIDMLGELQEHDPELAPIVTILNEALINIDEASSQLRAYTDRLEIDPMRMQQIEQRYSQALDLARKHGVRPEGLFEHHQQLSTELAELDNQDESLEELQGKLTVLQQNYISAAEKLSASRSKAGNKLAKLVEQHIQEMNMSQAKFSVCVEFDAELAPSPSGLDKVKFLISTNLGIKADTLEKVVSGGELSRVGLALQVISAKGNLIPTMIFDEVDTGISGPTASVVGKLLRKLGQTSQVICVTHLPQVAASGHQQMFVTKFSDKKTTETHMICLQENERIEELARLLAGDTLTNSAIANAKELLSSYH
ncbi:MULTISPECIES: DNA repair protein RecN [Alteromonadaceae]|uniref:DNA repair protein RecN n=1 Tax=Alteromonadaceae TaxID=72275 RepID=UPI001C0A4265|nr:MULTISPECIES: DNA repair protein RecN [Aliiglaciecola]MBU2878179.1 DNA repair protein RecN [Aliiglaciecola lipolytica]MDO6711640.1 DNA repair protein RecN [Aliiglaciecola sp. 2_MG-2023]MDO6752711.1 DNA repair protein RecN [Aliiglaciecola sp. 1_MG-2023]